MEQELMLEKTLQEMQRSQKRQEKMRWIQIGLIAAVLLLFISIFLFVVHTANRLTGAIDHVESSLVGAADNINEIAMELQEIDFVQLEDTIESFAQSGSDAVASIEAGMNGLDTVLSGAEEALSKLNDIDIDALNEGITQLNQVLKPISDFFGVFKK